MLKILLIAVFLFRQQLLLSTDEILSNFLLLQGFISFILGQNLNNFIDGPYSFNLSYYLSMMLYFSCIHTSPTEDHFSTKYSWKYYL